MSYPEGTVLRYRHKDINDASTVVILKDTSVLELRRGEKTTGFVKQTWPNVDAWIQTLLDPDVSIHCVEHKFKYLLPFDPDSPISIKEAYINITPTVTQEEVPVVQEEVPVVQEKVPVVTVTQEATPVVTAKNVKQVETTNVTCFSCFAL